jgi:hypothetical protein
MARAPSALSVSVIERGLFSRMANAWELLVGPPTPAPEVNDDRPAVATAALGRLSGVEIAAAPP